MNIDRPTMPTPSGMAEAAEGTLEGVSLVRTESGEKLTLIVSPSLREVAWAGSDLEFGGVIDTLDYLKMFPRLQDQCQALWLGYLRGGQEFSTEAVWGDEYESRPSARTQWFIGESRAS